MAKTDSEKNINARAIVEEGPAGIVLGAMVAGDWKSVLNPYGVGGPQLGILSFVFFLFCRVAIGDAYP